MWAVAALCGAAVRRNTLRATRDQRRLNQTSPEDPLRCANGGPGWRMAEIQLTSRLRRSCSRNSSLDAPIRACQTIRFTSRPNCPEAFSRRTRLRVAGARWERGAAPADLISRRNQCAAAGRMVADGSIPCPCPPSSSQHPRSSRPIPSPKPRSAAAVAECPRRPRPRCSRPYRRGKAVVKIRAHRLGLAREDRCPGLHAELASGA